MNTFKTLSLTILIVLLAFICKAQDVVPSGNLPYDPNEHKIIPDKFLELGLPILFIFILLNTIVAVLKNRADHQLKLRMVENGISDETLIQIFKESTLLSKLQPLKYFLFCFALSLALFLLHIFKNYLENQSGYLAVAIILLFTSAAFFLYYQILKTKLHAK